MIRAESVRADTRVFGARECAFAGGKDRRPHNLWVPRTVLVREKSRGWSAAVELALRAQCGGSGEWPRI